MMLRRRLIADLDTLFDTYCPLRSSHPAARRTFEAQQQPTTKLLAHDMVTSADCCLGRLDNQRLGIT